MPGFEQNSVHPDLILTGTNPRIFIDLLHNIEQRRMKRL